MCAQGLRAFELRVMHYRNKEPDVTFDNSGHGPLRVPGCGYSVIAERALDQRFAHGFHDWAQDRVTEREVHMLRYMNYVTDQPGWHDAVLHDLAEDVIARWEREAVAMWPLLSPRALAWCRAELRDKAEQFSATGGGLVTIFNAGARVCKADGLLAPELLRRLAAHVEALAQDHEKQQRGRWPQRVQRQQLQVVVGSDNNLVDQESDSDNNDNNDDHDLGSSDSGSNSGGGDSLAGPSSGGAETQPNLQETETPGLVDPNWLPLIYGQTPVLAQGGRVGCAGAVDAMGRGVLEPLPVYRWPRHLERPRRGGWRPVRDGRGRLLYDELAYRFSPHFQWLPCEVQFAPAPGNAESALGVRIASYINNLHPVRHHVLYRDIEACIAAVIPAWNEVLMLRSKGSHRRKFQGRDPPRIRTFGVTWSPPLPAWAAGLKALDKAPDKSTPEYQSARAQVLAYLREPENPLAARTPRYEHNIQVPHTLSYAVEQKHSYIKAWEHPEPGVAFTYEQWKAGHASAPVVPPPELERVDLADHEYYTVSLADTFQAQGLQVVVEIGSLDLRPGDVPPRDRWKVTGILNDHIVATAVVYFASDNVTVDSAGLDIRVEADIDPPIYCLDPWGGTPYHSSWALADVYGVVPEPAPGQVSPYFLATAPPVQELGTVVAPDGRLVVWPNAVQHRVRPLALRDPTRPGRRRFLKLHLVDPHYRVVSTRNVPPQQRAWWEAAGWDRIDWAERGLPPELVCMIGDDVFAAPSWPPSPEEARRLWTRARGEQAAVQGATFSQMCRSRYEE